LIDPAIKTLQKLETVWQVIKDDLQGLQDRANDHPDQVPNVVVEKVKLKNMIHRWNALAEKSKSIYTLFGTSPWANDWLRTCA
jgi:hypothetical protein